MSKKIVIKIKPNGEVEMDFQGFVGNQCFIERKNLETMLANLLQHSEVEIKLKPEYYQVAIERKERLSV